MMNSLMTFLQIRSNSNLFYYLNIYFSSYIIVVLDMKRINIQEYKPEMGILIDIQDPISFEEYHHPSSINIYGDKLLLNHQKYLDKNKKYYIVCRKGLKSRKVANMLEFYGYNVVQVSYY